MNKKPWAILWQPWNCWKLWTSWSVGIPGPVSGMGTICRRRGRYMLDELLGKAKDGLVVWAVDKRCLHQRSLMSRFSWRLSDMFISLCQDTAQEQEFGKRIKCELNVHFIIDTISNNYRIFHDTIFWLSLQEMKTSRQKVKKFFWKFNYYTWWYL